MHNVREPLLTAIVRFVEQMAANLFFPVSMSLSFLIQAIPAIHSVKNSTHFEASEGVIEDLAYAPPFQRHGIRFL